MPYEHLTNRPWVVTSCSPDLELTTDDVIRFTETLAGLNVDQENKQTSWDTSCTPVANSVTAFTGSYQSQPFLITYVPGIPGDPDLRDQVVCVIPPPCTTLEKSTWLASLLAAVVTSWVGEQVLDLSSDIAWLLGLAAAVVILGLAWLKASKAGSGSSATWMAVDGTPVINNPVGQVVTPASERVVAGRKFLGVPSLQS